MKSFHLAIFFLFIFLFSCGEDNKKAPPSSQVKKDSGKAKAGPIDTAQFLKDNNMSMAPYSTIPADGSMEVPGTSVYYPILNMGARAKLIIPSKFNTCD